MNKGLKTWGLAALLCASPGVGVSFTRIAGTGDPLPGAPGGENFLEVLAPQLEGDWIVARGYSAVESGIFAFNGGDAFRVMESQMQLPGVPLGARLSLNNASYDVDATGLVVFATTWLLGDPPEAEGTGVWLWDSTAGIRPLVLQGETVAGSDRPFLGGISLSIQGGVAVFEAAEGTLSDLTEAIYLWSPTAGCRRVIGPGFTSVTRPQLVEKGSRVAFLATHQGTHGVWSVALDGGDEQLLLDLRSDFPLAAPGSDWLPLGPFSWSTGQPLTGSPLTLAARATNSFHDHGIFELEGNGATRLLYNGSDPDPTTGLPHDGIDPDISTAGSDGAVAFAVIDPAQVGPTLGRRLMVRDAAGRYHLMAAEGRDFEGARVGLIEIMYGGMDGNRFAFNLLRTGDGAVWVADFGPPTSLAIPTVGGWGLAALVVLLAASAGVVLRAERRREH